MYCYVTACSQRTTLVLQVQNLAGDAGVLLSAQQYLYSIGHCLHAQHDLVERMPMSELLADSTALKQCAPSHACTVHGHQPS